MSKIICLDPGHSKGADSGAVGNGLREEDLTFDICQRIKALLEYNSFTVVMTRNDNYGTNSTVNESLKKRVNIAHSSGADLFVSVHINAGGGTGIEVFHYPGSVEGEKLASKMKYYLVQQSQMVDRGIKTGEFYVLKCTMMPAVLTENGFIDNPSDALKLGAEEFRQRIAIAHAKAVCDYFGQEYKEQGTKIQSAQPDKVQEAIALLEQGIKILKEK